MKFKAYPKIHRLGKEETDDILLGKVTIQEKIDGANISIWWDEEANMIKCGTRTRELPTDESFNGFQEAVRANNFLGIFFSDENNRHIRLYGEWLVKHGIRYDDLMMRPVGDNRKDSIVKEEIYEEQIKGHYNIGFVLDDRDQVVEMWRSKGLTCFQVAEGDF